MTAAETAAMDEADDTIAELAEAIASKDPLFADMFGFALGVTICAASADGESVIDRIVTGLERAKDCAPDWV